jgi:sirohydrochlorin ferrochelatase
VTSAVALVSHGTSSPAGRRAVAALIDAVTVRAPSRRVISGFVDVQQPDLRATLARADGGIVVPLLLSAGYHVHVDMRDAVRAETGRWVLAAALGPDARLCELLAHRLREAGWAPGDAIVLAAAGSSDPRAVTDCRDMASRLERELGCDVACGFISTAIPRLQDAVRAVGAARAGRRVVVATYLLAPGYFADLAAELALAAGAAVVSAPLVRADAPVSDGLVDIVLDRLNRAETAACDGSPAGVLRGVPEFARMREDGAAVLA